MAQETQKIQRINFGSSYQKAREYQFKFGGDPQKLVADWTVEPAFRFVDRHKDARKELVEAGIEEWWPSGIEKPDQKIQGLEKKSNVFTKDAKCCGAR